MFRFKEVSVTWIDSYIHAYVDKSQINYEALAQQR